MCVLGDGDYFGETALLTQAKRSATVTAKGNVDVFFMVRRQPERTRCPSGQQLVVNALKPHDGCAQETVRFNAMFGDDRKKLNVAFAHHAAVSAEASGARLDQLILRQRWAWLGVAVSVTESPSAERTCCCSAPVRVLPEED